MRTPFVIAMLTLGTSMQTLGTPPRTLPSAAREQLVTSLRVSRQHKAHVWRDTPPINADGTLNGYIEIPLGEHRKWEFSMEANVRAIDRVMPPDVGGYPVNYGFVPQTVSYDGDPFDILVLGPALPGGSVVRGISVGVMFMEDEKGLDSKVVVSPLDGNGRARYTLSVDDRMKIGGYFARYKKHEPGKFSKVPGWGSAEEGLAYVRTTHAFFRQCTTTAGECVLR